MSDEALCNVAGTLLLTITLIVINKLLLWEPPGGSD